MTVPLQELNRLVPKIWHRYPVPGGTVMPLPKFAIKVISEIMFGVTSARFLWGVIEASSVHSQTPLAVSYTHLTLPTKRIV